MNPNLSVYRYLTKLGNAHRVASTIFAILGELRQQHTDMSYAFEAATLLNEPDDSNNRRFRAYSTMLKLLTGSENSQWRAFAYPENSFIFVLQKQHLPDKESILNEYGRIFGKVFDDSSKIES